MNKSLIREVTGKKKIKKTFALNFKASSTNMYDNYFEEN